MANPELHAVLDQATNPRIVAANVLRKLAADLERDALGPFEMNGDPARRMVAVFELLLDGHDAELTSTELHYLKALGVPRSLVAPAER
jgi:hypothetical protein